MDWVAVSAIAAVVTAIVGVVSAVTVIPHWREMQRRDTDKCEKLNEEGIDLFTQAKNTPPPMLLEDPNPLDLFYEAMLKFEEAANVRFASRYQRAESYLGLARCQEELGFPVKQTVRTYSQAIRYRRELKDAFGGRGMAYYTQATSISTFPVYECWKRRRYFERAKNDFDTVLSLFPPDKVFSNYRSLCLEHLKETRCLSYLFQQIWQKARGAI